MAFKGLRRQGYCPYTVDRDKDGNEVENLGTGKVLPQVMKFSASPTSDTTTIYGDDAVAEEEVAQGNGGLTVDTANLSLEDQAALCGHRYSETEGMVCADGDVAPFCRCASLVPGVLRKKPFYRVVTYLRVSFAPVNDDYETRGKTISYKTPTLSGSFYPNCDREWKDVREFEDAAAALAYFNQMLNITAAAE